MELLVPDFMRKGTVETAVLYQTPALIAVDRRTVAGALQRPDLPLEFKAAVLVEPQASSSSVFVGTVAHKLLVQARKEPSKSLTAEAGRLTFRWALQLLDGVVPGTDRKRSERHEPEVVVTFRLAGIHDIRVLALQFGTDEAFFASVPGKWVASVTIKPNKSTLALLKALVDKADPDRERLIKARRVWMLFSITPTRVDKACAPVEPFSYVMREPWYIASEKGTPPHLRRASAPAGTALPGRSAAPEPAAAPDGTAVGGTTYSAPSAGAVMPSKRGKAKPAPAAVSGTGVGSKRKRSSTAETPPTSPSLTPLTQHTATESDRAQPSSRTGISAASQPGKGCRAAGGEPSAGDVDSSQSQSAPKRPRIAELPLASDVSGSNAGLVAPGTQVARSAGGGAPSASVGAPFALSDGKVIGLDAEDDGEDDDCDREQDERQATAADRTPNPAALPFFARSLGSSTVLSDGSGVESGRDDAHADECGTDAFSLATARVSRSVAESAITTCETGSYTWSPPIAADD